MDSSQTCTNCGTVNIGRGKFCKKCGAKLGILEVCPKCGNNLDSDSEFCEQCGFQIRKQTATAPPPPPLTPVAPFRRLPFGLEILIVLGLLGAAYYFFSSLMVIYGANTLLLGSSIYSQLVTAGALWALVGVYLAIVSIGLWKLRKWARTALILQVLLVIVGTYFNPVSGILGLFYCLLILWYLYQPHIKLLFETGQVRSMVASATVVSMVGLVCPKCGSGGRVGTMFCVKCGTKLPEAGG